MTTTDDTTTATGATASRPLFPRPVDPTPVEPEFMGGMQLPEDLISLYGHCSSFCAADAPTYGATVEDHGPACSSTATGYASGWTFRGERVTISTELTAAYSHGIYELAEIRGRRDGRTHGSPWVDLVLSYGQDAEGEREVHFYLDEAQALALMVSLQRATDALNSSPEEIRGAKRRRETCEGAGIQDVERVLGLRPGSRAVDR